MRSTSKTSLPAIQVRLGETLRLYSNWSGVAIDDLKAQNQLGKRGGLRFGRAFVLSLTPKAYRAFKMAREEYFTKLENEFFAHFEVVKLHRYKVERGDNLWKVAKRHGDLPIWVLEKFNNASDLARLSVGKDLLLPELKEITSGKLRAAATIWKDAPGGAPGDAPDAGRPGEAPKRTAAERAAKKAPKAEVAARRGLVVSVAKGESLRLYARWSGVGSKSIIRANPGIDPSRLRIGQKVHVPMPDQRISAFYRLRRKHNGLRTPAALTERPARRAPTRDAKRFIRHRVKKGESAWKIAVKRYNISVGDLRRANPGKDLSALQVGDVLKVPLPAARPGGPRRVRAP